MSAPRSRLRFAPPISPDDLIRHALGAYYAAVRACTPPIGDPDPQTWSSPDDFGQVIEEELRRRVARQLYGPIVDEPAFPGLTLRVPKAVAQ